MTRPFLSVVMPVHEGADWIRTTLNSLTWGPTDELEIIVIDSSSSAGTMSIVQEFEARLPLRRYERPDLKPWQAKTNLGVELATADYVCMLHQDDLWRPERVDTVRRWIRQSPEVSLHLAPTFVVDRRGKRIGRWRCPLPADQILDPGLILSRLLVQNFISVPAPVVRRQAWRDCHGMDEALWYTPDWDVWLKLTELGPTIYHSEATTDFRVHGNSLTVTGSRDEAAFRKQMDTVLERHIPRLRGDVRVRVEQAARASIDVNVALATAAFAPPPTAVKELAYAALKVLALGPRGVRQYLRDSRLSERLVPRLRSKLAGAF